MQLQVLAHRSAQLTIVTLFTLLFAQCAKAQTLVNGQVFTQGLAILDSPAPNSELHAGSTMSVAIDVSGDGKLAAAASIPGSGLPTRFDSLELFLISQDTQLNITVSTGTGLLTQETGSTVKHLNFAIPNCAPAGNYNLTLYEASHIDNTAYFSITPIPLKIDNTAATGSCTSGVNVLLQPSQESSSPPELSPWVSATNTHVGAATSTTAGIPASSITPSSPATTTTLSGMITVTVTSGTLPFSLPTPSTNTDGTPATSTVGGITVTVVVASYETEVVTTISAGATDTYTTTVEVLSTTTAVMDGSQATTGGFIPVNAATTMFLPISFAWVLVGCLLLGLLKEI